MARYEHLPIYKAAFDLACEVERVVRAFSRYNKYTLGSELRQKAHGLVDRVIEANGSRERVRVLEALRSDVESFKVHARLCQEVNAFSSAGAFLSVAEKAVTVSRQNEGWLRYATGAGVDRSGEVGHGQSRAG